MIPNNHILTPRIPDPVRFHPTLERLAPRFKPVLLGVGRVSGFHRGGDVSIPFSALAPVPGNTHPWRGVGLLKLSNSHSLDQLPLHRKRDMPLDRFRTS